MSTVEDQPQSKKFVDLRRQAEEALRGLPIALTGLSTEDIQHLIHELQVHQIELEMQNDTLGQIQQELEESRDKYFDLYDFAPVGYFTVDKDGVILEANLTGASLLGEVRTFLIKKPLSRFIARDSQDAFYLHRQKVLATQTQQTCELKLVRKSGGQFYAHLESISMADSEGQGPRFRTAVLDITKRKQVEEEREKLIADLDLFAHTVAHDLKDPLAQIVGYAGFLKEDYLTLPTEELQEYLQVIVSIGVKLSNIVDTLLLLANVRRKKVVMKPLDMSSIVTEVLQRLAYEIDQTGAEIILPTDWPAVVGYSPWVEEVWTNYISNALKYGGQPTYVELGATAIQESDHVVQFWVRDNGPGLNPQAQAQLFKPFTRLDEGQSKGQGLGLSIVLRIVEKLGGQVGVESDGLPGRGCVFSFTLPGGTD